jgi:photosystem II stability/assembly factor-like uncharacterized protein
MRKFTFLLLSLFVTVSGLAKTVTINQARIVADNYISHYSDRIGLDLDNSFSVQYNNITVYHVFNYRGGGFVVVSADDAVLPVLAQSNEGYLDQNISNPNAKYWFDSYSKEIGHIITVKLDNTETLKQWNRIRSNEFDQAIHDAGPLLTTTWDQGEWYNYYCPDNPNIPGGHVLTGCVATAMGQIMKYHSFPEQGLLSHSYVHPIFGIQTANFGTTIYNWGEMGNSANSINFQAISTLLYHVGVSVDMNYGIGASGAPTENVPTALTTYFNYDPSSISIEYKEKYTEIEWKELLKAELNASRPIYYAGYEGDIGHAWVCDGWRVGDDMFHMNWGWSGSFDGWYAMGALNSLYSYNTNNEIVKGIKPGNPDLIVRITNIQPNQLIGYGQTVDIDCSVIKGTPNTVNLYMDSELLYSTSQANFTYNLVTTDHPMGVHILKIEAFNETDTVYSEVKVGNCEWVSQASAFTHETRGIQYIHAVDSLVVWATAYDGNTPTNPIQEFTRTGNGGETWKSGIIPNCSRLSPAMIFALNIDTAYCPMFRRSGSRPQGIYMTSNGGSYWSIQTDAIFIDPVSFPNVVHFFNNSDGFCMGDPVNGEYEIYTTSDCGNNWTLVIAGNIPDPVSDEYGVVGYYSAIGDRAWFGTSKGRVYRTSDKGNHWNVSTTSLAGKYVDVEFADELHGLAQDKDLNTSGALSETFDGGVTWNTVIITGEIGTTDFCFVPGTDNMWVSTDAGLSDGAFCSYDGGHSWAPLALANSAQLLAVDFVSDSCGWAGGFNESATKGGMFRYGSTPHGSVLSPVTNLYATITGAYVSLTWNAPSFGNITGYNVYRNDTLLKVLPVTSPFCIDVPVPNGLQTYCITVVYVEGESEAVCIDAWITYGIPENEATVKVYPNPATDVINIETPVNFSQVSILTLLGQEVYRYAAQAKKLKILTAGFDRGIYIMQINLGNMRFNSKISIN